MKARAGALGVWERGGDYFDVVRGEERAKLLDACLVRAIAVANQQSFGIQPNYIASFDSGWGLDFSQRWNVQSGAAGSLGFGFCNPIRLAGSHENHAVVRGEGWVVGVHGVECQSVFVWREGYHFGPGLG